MLKSASEREGVGASIHATVHFHSSTLNTHYMPLSRFPLTLAIILHAFANHL